MERCKHPRTQAFDPVNHHIQLVSTHTRIGTTQWWEDWYCYDCDLRSASEISRGRHHNETWHLWLAWSANGDNYVCACVCVCMCMYLAHVCVHVCMYVSACVCMCMCVYMCVCVPQCALIYSDASLVPVTHSFPSEWPPSEPSYQWPPSCLLLSTAISLLPPGKCT